MLKNKTKTTKDHQNNFQMSKPKLYEVLHVTTQYGTILSRITKFNSTSRISPINYLKNQNNIHICDTCTIDLLKTTFYL